MFAPTISFIFDYLSLVYFVSRPVVYPFRVFGRCRSRDVVFMVCVSGGSLSLTPRMIGTLITGVFLEFFDICLVIGTPITRAQIRDTFNLEWPPDALERAR